MSDDTRELLFSVTKADLRIDTFAAGGKGGQHQNKTASAVRITHLASGAVGEARDSRSQHQNKIAAFRRMAESPKFQTWHRLEVARRLGMEDQIKRAVDAAMKPANLRVEVHDEKGRWVPAPNVLDDGATLYAEED